jgi:hypothetical protein
MFTIIRLYTYEGDITFTAYSNQQVEDIFTYCKLGDDALTVEHTLPLVQTVECYRRWKGNASELIFSVEHSDLESECVTIMMQRRDPNTIHLRFHSDVDTARSHLQSVVDYYQSETSAFYDTDEDRVDYLVEDNHWIVQGLKPKPYCLV